MIPEESARKLHDRATRGEVLSAEEGAALDRWLAAQDEAEAALLSRKSAELSVAELRAEIKSVLMQVGSTTRTIQQVTAENDALRRDVETLRQQFVTRPLSRPA